MPRKSHQLLSAVPVLLPAYLAVWATAFPTRAAKAYSGFSGLLMSDAPFFWLCVALITVYAALWWWTSRVPQTRRQRIQAGLRPHCEVLTRHLNSIKAANSYEEVAAVIPSFDHALNYAGQWLLANMGRAAFEKFKTPDVSACDWTWPGDHPPGAAAKRSNILSQNSARLEVLDTFLRYDGWDGEEPSLAQRIKRRVAKWKKTNASTSS